VELEKALQEHEEQVDTLLKNATKYVGALKAWKKACQLGHLANLQKAALQSEELSGTLPQTTGETKNAWEFDVREYLLTEAWRKELSALVAERYGFRPLTAEDEESLISSPILIRSNPIRYTLTLGKVNWSAIRPKVVAAELKRLRDRTAAGNAQEFVESLYGACVYLSNKNDPNAKFRDIYDLFCLTPGYKKENPPAVFGQQLYGLHRSEIRATRGGRKIEIEYSTGNYKEKDVFSVISEDGRTIRYFTIFFR